MVSRETYPLPSPRNGAFFICGVRNLWGVVGGCSCSSCGKPRDRKGQRYCRACHAAYVRANRPSYSDLSDEEKYKANSRSIANVYQRRGKIKPQPCEDCGSEFAEKHHDDYAQPLKVRWKCRDCHVAHHAPDRETAKRVRVHQKSARTYTYEFELSGPVRVTRKVGRVVAHCDDATQERLSKADAVLLARLAQINGRSEVGDNQVGKST